MLRLRRIVLSGLAGMLLLALGFGVGTFVGVSPVAASHGSCEWKQCFVGSGTSCQPDLAWNCSVIIDTCYSEECDDPGDGCHDQHGNPVPC